MITAEIPLIIHQLSHLKDEFLYSGFYVEKCPWHGTKERNIRASNQLGLKECLEGEPKCPQKTHYESSTLLLLPCSSRDLGLILDLDAVFVELHVLSVTLWFSAQCSGFLSHVKVMEVSGKKPVP